MTRYLSTPHTVRGAHSVSQDDLGAQLRSRIDSVPGSQDILRSIGFIYARSGITERHFEAAPDALSKRSDWYAFINETVLALATRTLSGLPDGALKACDALIVVSTSYAGFPSLSRRLQEPFEIPLDAICYDLSGLGCAGPTQGLHLANALLDQGRKRVCVLWVDVMGTFGASRQFQTTPELSEVVAHCLASDGAAALMVSREPTEDVLLSYESCAFRTQLWGQSLDQNDYTACGDNQPYISVGKDIRTRLVDETVSFFGPDVVSNPLLLHPGGMALMRTLRANHPELIPWIDIATNVLQENGNLGSASLVFVLQRAISQRMNLGPALNLFALGPGIVTTQLTLEGVQGVSHV